MNNTLLFGTFLKFELGSAITETINRSWSCDCYNEPVPEDWLFCPVCGNKISYYKKAILTTGLKPDDLMAYLTRYIVRQGYNPTDIIFSIAKGGDKTYYAYVDYLLDSTYGKGTDDGGFVRIYDSLYDSRRVNDISLEIQEIREKLLKHLELLIQWLDENNYNYEFLYGVILD